MIGYTCKYTPIELLCAYGGDCVLLNEEKADISFAESCLHDNLCCHAKAFLQTCHDQGVKELVLVSCCDSIRRIYDILSAAGDMDFLFLLDLPHTFTTGARQMLKNELLLLASKLSGYTKKQFDYELFVGAFKEAAAPPETGFVGVLGARVSTELLSYMQREVPAPVFDLTCGANRFGANHFISPPGGDSGFDALMEWYAGELLAGMPCMRMLDISKREALVDHPHMKGIIYHTVKFCDYYAFEYEKIKKSTKLPIVKLESDFTPHCYGQISTRLGAFVESGAFDDSTAHEIKPKTAPETARKKASRRGDDTTEGKYFAGIDSGSTSTNVVVLDASGAICAGITVKTGSGAQTSAASAFEAATNQLGISMKDIGFIVATGYGRTSITDADSTVTEITCHAKGAHHLEPSVRTVIDIGGQDSKVIALDENGAVVNFAMNDKCAAGTGRFLDMMAATLEMDRAQMSEAGLLWKEELTISSMCTVFAQSEVISLIADNKSQSDIIRGINKSVASKTLALMARVDAREEYMMTGGVAANKGVARAIEDKLGSALLIAENPELCGALGAALFAYEKVQNSV